MSIAAKKNFVCALCLAVSAAAVCALFAQSAKPSASASVFAEEEFRRGVQAYYRGSFNDAVFQFEKTLSYIPDNALALDWLGKAYYKSGLEGAALRQWDHAVSAGYGGQLLKTRMEIIRGRRVENSLFNEKSRFADAGVFPGSSGGVLYFSQPSSVLPLEDGSCWAAAYGSNELLHFSVNGAVIDRRRGPLNGFDRPMDIIRMPDGRMAVTEYAGDRITFLTADGAYISSFGTSGRNEGQLLGPQYISANNSGNIYVTDFGNARVSVFDAEGTFLFAFGAAQNGFSGLKAPSGIACTGGCVYVADSVYGAVYAFDEAGNFLHTLVPENTFAKPEALKIYDSYLLCADGSSVRVIDLKNGAVFNAAKTTANNSRVTCAVCDVNGNLLVTDFIENEIYVMARMSDLIGGLFVQIDRVYADNFPEIQLDIRVENLNRGSITGLQGSNFFISEEKRPVSEQKLVGAAYKNSFCDITILVDRSEAMAGYADAVQTAVRGIAEAMDGQGTMRVISAGSIPVLEASGSPRMFASFSASSLKAALSPRVALDLGIRLAANGLVTAEPKRAVVYISAPGRNDASSGVWAALHSFEKYGLTDLTAYLNNNSIRFYTVNVTQNALPAEMKYITEQTGGSSWYIYRREGIAGIVKSIAETPSGLYRISYTSHLPTNFGRKFLPVEAEVYLQNRSGRDETGYFAPLQ
ncbi:MAG: hypothetical protein NC041_07330 [Bacteroides sp.]|nr:hypothetical protein [Prevotella sp.]MCM1407110.1 hypothetical protein [Treponema brennaborense]MCM1470262.1 hypothetical protein [Bacteroides sp.]